MRRDTPPAISSGISHPLTELNCTNCCSAEGLKQELIDRLEEALDAEVLGGEDAVAEVAAPAPAPVPAPAPAVPAPPPAAAPAPPAPPPVTAPEAMPATEASAPSAAAGGNSDAAKLAARASKFGIPLSSAAIALTEEERRKSRVAKFGVVSAAAPAPAAAAASTATSAPAALAPDRLAERAKKFGVAATKDAAQTIVSWLA